MSICTCPVQPADDVNSHIKSWVRSRASKGKNFSFYKTI